MNNDRGQRSSVEGFKVVMKMTVLLSLKILYLWNTAKIFDRNKMPVTLENLLTTNQSPPELSKAHATTDSSSKLLKLH